MNEQCREREQVKKNVALCKELLKAAERGETERVKELMQCEGVDVHHAEARWGVPKTALVLACQEGHLEVVCAILEHGGEEEEELEKALCGAVWGGHVKVVKLLLERGVDAAVSQNSALRWAAQFGHSEVVELLLKDPRVDPAAQDNYAVRQAARNGHVDALMLLLCDCRVDGTF